MKYLKTPFAVISLLWVVGLSAIGIAKGGTLTEIAVVVGITYFMPFGGLFGAMMAQTFSNR